MDPAVGDPQLGDVLEERPVEPLRDPRRHRQPGPARGHHHDPRAGSLGRSSDRMRPGHRADVREVGVGTVQNLGHVRCELVRGFGSVIAQDQSRYLGAERIGQMPGGMSRLER